MSAEVKSGKGRECCGRRQKRFESTVKSEKVNTNKNKASSWHEQKMSLLNLLCWWPALSKGNSCEVLLALHCQLSADGSPFSNTSENIILEIIRMGMNVYRVFESGFIKSDFHICSCSNDTLSFHFAKGGNAVL